MCPLVKIILNFSANGHKAKGTFYVLTNSFLAFFLFGFCFLLGQLLVQLSKVN